LGQKNLLPLNFEDQSSVNIMPPLHPQQQEELDIELNLITGPINETSELINIPMLQNEFGSFSHDSSSIFPVFKSH
jgi:hypothetical protein